MGIWKQTVAQARNRRIFEIEFDDFLPRRIVDFHVHVFPRSVNPGRRPFSCAGHPLREYLAGDFFRDSARVYPGREVRGVFFGMPFQGWRQRANDLYVARACDCVHSFPVRLLDPATDSEELLRKDVAEHGFVGLKPYPDYVRGVARDRVRLHHMLPDWAMQVADEMGLLVILHLPRPGRLADPVNRRDIAGLCRRWPRARIVLAHVGRAYYLRNALIGLSPVADISNLWFDTAMLNNWEVLALLFRRVAPSRILYGTDTPIALAPGKSVEINDQYTYVTPVPWELSIHDSGGKLQFTSFLYEELRAIKRAVEETGWDGSFIERLFFRNAMELLKSCVGSGKQERRKE